jgi:protein ImuB
MFAAFHLANLPMVAALLEQPGYRHRPCAILRNPSAKDDGKIPLLALNEVAAQTGVAPGWPLNRALVRCPDLQVIPRQLNREDALRAELAKFAERFTADVEITSRDTVLLDLAGTRRVHFRGLETLPSSEVEVYHALADTPDLAHFAVLEPATRGRFIATSEIAALPLAVLAKWAEGSRLLPLLELLGLRTLAEYLLLPRQALIERFGPLAGHWHDLISGKTCRLLKLHRPPESLLQSLDFDDPIPSSDALIFVFNRLLHSLASRLTARHLTAAVLDIRLCLEVGDFTRKIYLPESSADPAVLLKPIQTMVDSLVLPSPVVSLTLDALAATPFSRQRDWTQRQLPNPERWADTLARLQALVGCANLGIPLPSAVHRPDAFTLRDAADVSEISPVSPTLPACSIPLRRFRPPVEISVAFEAGPDLYPQPLALLTGPHCGQVLERLGPFLTSGDVWNPTTAWQRVEWDVLVPQSPPLRLVYQPGDRWQLDGSYS